MIKKIYLVLCLGLFWVPVASQNLQTLSKDLDSLSSEVVGLQEYVDFTLVEAPLSELIRAVAETHDLNVSIGNIPSIAITNNFNHVKVADLFLFICSEYGIQLKFINNIFTFYQNIPEIIEDELVSINDSGNVTINVQNKQLTEFAKVFTQRTSFNLVVHQSAQNVLIQSYLQNIDPEKAIEILAESNNLILSKKGANIFQLEQEQQIADQRNGGYGNSSRNANQFKPDLRGTQLSCYFYNGKPFLNLNCYRASIGDLIKQVADELKIDYLILSEPSGQMTCHLDSISFDVFLSTALESGGMAFARDERDIYYIGDDKKNGLSRARVYAFLNRTVEGIDEIIPQVLLQQVQVKPFKDLNALIITGSDLPVARLVEFLKQIDHPVPNVLIEVMVVEVRKGSSVRTGIKAFLGDSVPNTSGQLFSGVDLTLSSASFNRILNNLDSRGIMNLGRVTPQFYATVQAMEENNNLNIRSTPKLSTLNGHEATLTIGQSVYYLIETQNVTGGVNPIVTVTPRYEKVEANLDLKLTPFVSDLEDVTLSIDAEFSDFIAPEVQGAPPGNATRKFISKIRVKNEEMIVIGGLEEVSRSQTGSGIPFLSRIPLLKWLFSSKSKDKTDNKLLIFIKPTVVY